MPFTSVVFPAPRSPRSTTSFGAGSNSVIISPSASVPPTLRVRRRLCIVHSLTRQLRLPRKSTSAHQHPSLERGTPPIDAPRYRSPAPYVHPAHSTQNPLPAHVETPLPPPPPRSCLYIARASP